MAGDRPRTAKADPTSLRSRENHAQLLTAVALLTLLLGTIPTAGAADLVSEPRPGCIATDNVEWLGNIPVNTDSAGGRKGFAPVPQILVVDVTDKSNPHVISELQGVHSHTVSCVLDCIYAYNSDGKIIDLTDPTSPELVGDWAQADGRAGVKGAYDVTEVAPGIVVTSSNPMLVLDANSDPANPTPKGSGKPSDGRFPAPS